MLHLFIGVCMQIRDFLSVEKLRSWAGSSVFKRGEQYFKLGRVELLTDREDMVEARVQGTEIYYASYGITATNELWHKCSCPYLLFCKHLVALGLVILNKNSRSPDRSQSIRRAQVRRMEEWETYLQQLSEAEQEKEAVNWKLIFELEIFRDKWKISARRAYIRKDGTLGRRGTLHPWNLRNLSRQMHLTEKEKFALAYLDSEPEIRSGAAGAFFLLGSEYSMFNRKGESCGLLFDLIRESHVFVLMHHSVVESRLEFESRPGRIEMRLQRKDGGFVGQPYLVIGDTEEPIDDSHYILTSNPIWILRENRLIRIEGLQDSQALLPFTDQQFKLKIPYKKLGAFLKEVGKAPELARVIQLPEDMAVTDRSVEPVPRLYLGEREGHLVMELKFCYEDLEVSLNDPERVLYHTHEEDGRIRCYSRKPEKESEYREKLLQTGARYRDGMDAFWVPDKKALDWLLTQPGELAEQGFEIYGEENLQKYRIRRAYPTVRIQVSSGIDWFDLNLIVDFEGILVSLATLRKALRHNQRYIKLSDGSMVRLPEEFIRRFQYLLQVGEKKDDQTLSVSKFHATLIDLLSQEADQFQADPQYDEIMQKLRNFQGIKKVRPPRSLRGTLRNYQKAGLEWMLFLKEFGFGGCLADDMGLGKTIQALALLLHEKRLKPPPSLIVAPTSVVFNWEKEAAKFAPSLKILRHTGLDRERSTAAFEQYDVVLTTYGILRRDISFLKDFSFHYVILDESQNIKNPQSQTAKAARLLKATHRLVLTGTPVENNTLELWSQMAFLNPGLLGSQKAFISLFANPIEKKGDRETAEFLHRLVYPFILRRTKEQVEKDLPPKTETVIYTTMEPEQEKLYNTWRDYYRAAILQHIDTHGLNQSRMAILEGLMKLRQIACHPRLVEPNGNLSSGKYQALLEHLEEILAEGHKVLVFSQFVKMLKILREYLDEKKIEYEYLDGRTRNREERVQNFQQNDRVRLFLISLRAGGTGLNLTAADYVIHYDPWWNPAVENQASDRTHRIGQDKHVFIYKFITRGTVEEKVLQLQEKKRRLVDTLITSEKAFFKKLTAEEIEALFN